VNIDGICKEQFADFYYNLGLSLTVHYVL